MRSRRAAAESRNQFNETVQILRQLGQSQESTDRAIWAKIRPTSRNTRCRGFCTRLWDANRTEEAKQDLLRAFKAIA